MPCLAIFIDLIRGAHDALIADLTRLRICIPFCDVGLEINSITYSGMISVADMCFVRFNIMSLMLSVCSDLKLNMSLLFFPSVNTSAHNV